MKWLDSFHLPLLIRHHTSEKSAWYKFQDRAFTTIIYSSYFLLVVSSLGFSQLAPTYLQNLDYYVRIYICLFLIWRFNPFSKIDQFTDLDRKIAYSAGVFILTTTVLNTYLKDVEAKIKDSLLPSKKEKETKKEE